MRLKVPRFVMLQQKDSTESSHLIPLRWPIRWAHVTALAFLKNSGINCLLIEKDSGYDDIVTQATDEGFTVMDASESHKGIHVLKGVWPGVKLTESGKVDQTSAGPTGDPWVDSNGWRVRLAAALHPDTAIWVDAPAPVDSRLRPEAFAMAVADSAVYGGSWIVSLDDELAGDIAENKPQAMEKWNKLTAATRFFSSHPAWADYEPAAVVGILSSFSGKNQAFSGELLNLVARTNQQYRILVKTQISETSCRSLKAVIYVDAETPSGEVKENLLAFVQAGGLLITGPTWGDVPGADAKDDEHLPYSVHTLGKGRVMVAKARLTDPYAVAQDSMVLISHRNDLLRFWNGGAIGSFLTLAPEGKSALLQLLFYASGRSAGSSVRVAGQYKVAMLSTPDQTVPQRVEAEVQKDALELHLPSISQYAAVELEGER